MSFLNIFGLLGLLSLPVIVALHLLRERQRRYVISNLELWSFLDKEVSGPRSMRIPLTWLLLLDLLIAALVSLAWAQPRLTLHLPVQPAHHLVILLDVSSSMRALDGTSSRFSQARSQAMKLVDERGGRDVITILAFGRRASLVADSRLDGFPALVERLGALQAGETGQADAFRQALASGQAALEKDPNQVRPAEFYVFTDGSFPLENLEEVNRFPHPLNWRFIGRAADNQAIIGLNATPLGQNQYQVFARLANLGNRPAARTLTLEVDGRQVDQSSVNLPPNSSVVRVWRITAATADAKEGGSPAELRLTLRGRDPLPEDDSASLGLQPAGKIRVALVADEPGLLQQAVRAIPGTELTLIAPADYATRVRKPGQAPFELTIFRGFIPPDWPTGQVLLVEPPEQHAAGEAPTATAQPIFAQSRATIPSDATVQEPNPSPLVEGIDFSGVRWSRAWSLAAMPAGFIPLLQANGTPLLLQGEAAPAQNSRGAGFSQILVLLADLTQGNFTQHPAFPILMANLVEFARQTPLPPSFQTGEAVPLPSAGTFQSIQVTPPKQAPVELDRQWPAAWVQTLDPGLYRFRFVRADGEAVEFSAGARTGDQMESDLSPRSWTQSIPAAGRGPSGLPAPQAQVIDLWPWLLGAAILLLVVEAILAWRS